MRRLIIICEGETEQEFCKDVLSPFLAQKQIFIDTPRIKKTRGGIADWSVIKKEVETYLRQDTAVFVTTLMDYYGLMEKHQFPEWDRAEQVMDKSIRMGILEQGMKDSLSPELQSRFIPYIQLHEFEALLFTNKEVLLNSFLPREIKDQAYLEETFREQNPEMINNGRTTAPSKRLERSIEGYNKVLYGSMIASEIGLENIMAACPRFAVWVGKLKSL
ncbi:DUF4276 family protein [Algivirga pacifica]|uniref:DUF4276 family protein n=1 Tax=Algivirga pacifica TaxID=1162670 RepID=A0ABP9DQ95_9BACT